MQIARYEWLILIKHLHDMCCLMCVYRRSYFNQVLGLWEQYQQAINSDPKQIIYPSLKGIQVI